MEPVRVGVVGAGPWAQMMHAPMLAKGPQTALSAVWGRRPSAAQELAAAYNAYGTDDFDAFLDHCDAVSFAVPPDVQAELAPVAAAAGKPLLLEKPIALTLEAAQAMTEAIEAAGVPTQIVLSRRYSKRIRSFLDELQGLEITGLRTSFVSGAFLDGSPFRTPWRLREGALLDVGPHVLDMMDAVAGRIEDISYTGDPRSWLAVTTRHANGAVGQASISSVVPGFLWDLDVFGPGGIVSAPQRPDDERDEVKETIVGEFALACRSGVSHTLDVRRGLYLQELMQGGGAART
jgi:predicted dehydrogenase